MQTKTTRGHSFPTRLENMTFWQGLGQTGSVNSHSHFAEQFGNVAKTKGVPQHHLPLEVSAPEKQALHRRVGDVHCSIVFNSENVETTEGHE